MKTLLRDLWQSLLVTSFPRTANSPLIRLSIKATREGSRYGSFELVWALTKFAFRRRFHRCRRCWHAATALRQFVLFVLNVVHRSDSRNHGDFTPRIHRMRVSINVYEHSYRNIRRVSWSKQSNDGNKKLEVKKVSFRWKRYAYTGLTIEYTLEIWVNRKKGFERQVPFQISKLISIVTKFLIA